MDSRHQREDDPYPADQLDVLEAEYNDELARELDVGAFQAVPAEEVKRLNARARRVLGPGTQQRRSIRTTRPNGRSRRLWIRGPRRQRGGRRTRRPRRRNTRSSRGSPDGPVGRQGGAWYRSTASVASRAANAWSIASGENARISVPIQRRSVTIARAIGLELKTTARCRYRAPSSAACFRWTGVGAPPAAKITMRTWSIRLPVSSSARR